MVEFYTVDDLCRFYRDIVERKGQSPGTYWLTENVWMDWIFLNSVRYIKYRSTSALKSPHLRLPFTEWLCLSLFLEHTVGFVVAFLQTFHKIYSMCWNLHITSPKNENTVDWMYLHFKHTTSLCFRWSVSELKDFFFLDFFRVIILYHFFLSHPSLCK